VVGRSDSTVGPDPEVRERAIEALTSAPLFARLDPSGLEAIADISASRWYRRGQPIFFEGDPGDRLFLLVEGAVKIFVTSRQGEEMVLVTLGPGETFGELAAIGGGVRSASAETLERSLILTLNRPALMNLLQQWPEIMQGVLESLSDVVRRLTGRTADFVFLDLYGRVAKLLLSLAGEVKEEQNVVVDLHMTQSDLARMVGVARQSFNNALHELARRGYIELQGKRIVLLDVERLRSRAGV
jgi:CRP/FNR family transcriptional regulator, cyclic AMP receptor protein